MGSILPKTHDKNSEDRDEESTTESNRFTQIVRRATYMNEETSKDKQIELEECIRIAK